MKNNTRINLTMNISDVFIQLSRETDGGGYNPGGLQVALQIYTEAPRVDPDNALGGMGLLLMLDSYRIYGSHIWLIYKDICSESIDRMIGLLRAVQLGFYSSGDLKKAISQRAAGLVELLDKATVDGLIEKVRERLPNFKG